ncbi:hypothetical protein PI126_g12744 [Phytophthora idaei]|nr:hypothetical protein PI126_g12744 [Phytophthora idaei]
MYPQLQLRAQLRYQATDMAAGQSTPHVDEDLEAAGCQRSTENLIPTSPHISDDEASAAGSDEEYVEPDDGKSESVEASECALHHQENEVPNGDVATETLEMIDEPNTVAPGDNPEDFAILDSDGESENTSVFDDDEDLGLCEPDPVIEETASSPDVHFDPSLLHSVSGVGEIVRGSVHADVLKDMKFNGWSAVDSRTPYAYMDEPYESRSNTWISDDYPNIYQGEHGPTDAALAAASTAMVA